MAEVTAGPPHNPLGSSGQPPTASVQGRETPTGCRAAVPAQASPTPPLNSLVSSPAEKQRPPQGPSLSNSYQTDELAGLCLLLSCLAPDPREAWQLPQAAPGFFPSQVPVSLSPLPPLSVGHIRGVSILTCPCRHFGYLPELCLSVCLSSAFLKTKLLPWVVSLSTFSFLVPISHPPAVCLLAVVHQYLPQLVADPGDPKSLPSLISRQH